MRSVITLKLLTFWPTGGIVAAPTTSLPEKLGGGRNWDYRYCWLRDASLTLYALLNAGYRKEAEAWRAWLLRAASGHPDQLNIMYGIAGERWLPETVVPWLKGYENSSPVRIGNAAVEQLQLDVYGEVMGALHTSRAADLTPMHEAWRLQRVMLRKLATLWNQPDKGIWEMRGPPRHFTYSRMMCWLAYDRAIQSAERFNLEGDLPRWRELRATIHAEICAHGFNPQLNSFTQSYGDTSLDASLLLMVKTGFLPPKDPRIEGTIAAIERELLQDGLVLRYLTTNRTDGLEGDEGAFLACSFWLVDAYIMQGRKKDARALYDRLLSLRNDLGLLAEEYDSRAQRLVGNFPQAFSHVGLINSTYDLIDVHGPSRQQAACTAPTWSDPEK